MKKILLTTVAVSVLALPAMAADLAPVYKAPPPAVPGWTGFYVGGTLGGAWNDNSVDVVTTNTFVNTGILSALGRSAGPASARATTGSVGAGWTSVTGGFEAGYNWQFGPSWLVGLETDFDVLSNQGGPNTLSQVVARDPVNSPGFNYTGTIGVTQHLDWLGTVRGRLGFLVTPSWLVYGTGGLAYGGASSSTSITGRESGTVPGDPFTTLSGAGSYSGTRVGWTAGAGLEYLFATHWTVKAEWLHYDLGSVTYGTGPMNAFLGANLAFTDVSSSTVKFSGDIVRAGVNYKF